MFKRLGTALALRGRVMATLAKLAFKRYGWGAVDRVRSALLATAASGAPIRVSFAQDGEDLFLLDHLAATGFYVDVGAHHPHRFSVTHLLYEKGWRGINIDVTAAITTDFPRFRSGDVNHRGLVGRTREATFFHFAEPSVSTLDPQRASDLVDRGWIQTHTEDLTVTPLTEILDHYSAPTDIGLLCIDVEGSNLEVLQSMDWERYRVGGVLVEPDSPDIPPHTSEVVEYLTGLGFQVRAVFGRSVFLEHSAPEV